MRTRTRSSWACFCFYVSIDDGDCGLVVVPEAETEMLRCSVAVEESGLLPMLQAQRFAASVMLRTCSSSCLANLFSCLKWKTRALTFTPWYGIPPLGHHTRIILIPPSAYTMLECDNSNMRRYKGYIIVWNFRGNVSTSGGISRHGAWS